MKSKIKRDDLRDQFQKDTDFFNDMPNNVKNALISELKKFWPKANQIWPTKFSYEQKELFEESIDNPK